MSKPAEYDIDMCQGSDFKIKLVIKDNTGTPLDITGWTFAAEMRRTISDSTVLAAFSFNITDAVNGEVEMAMDAATTGALPLKDQKENTRETEDFAYDVERTDGGGDIQRIIQGVVKVSPEVTRV